MSSSGNNNANTDSGGGGGGNDNAQTILAIVALVISIIALGGTVLQILQQYLASAAGYANCNKAVMSGWHITKRRTLVVTELRIRVSFKTPVFFVCPADNERRPFQDIPIDFVDGSVAKQIDTLVLSQEEAQASEAKEKAKADDKDANADVDIKNLDLEKASNEKADRKKKGPKAAGSALAVHTVNGEMATWVRLLQQIHKMEAESEKWQLEQFHENSRDRARAITYSQHKLCVAIQAMDHTWDTMPTGVTRPFATSTIAHIVEMAAMLGIYWKEFDHSTQRYRAEGNGYMLTGSLLPDIGIMFTFQICGKSVFESNRIIPVDEVKELAFGKISTIFRTDKDPRRIRNFTGHVQDLRFLLLGSTNKLAETLVELGCNTKTSNCLRDDTQKHGHLFPLAFELIGMLGRTLHMPGSVFHQLPNPTCYRWDNRYFSLQRLLESYTLYIQDPHSSSEQYKTLQALSIEVTSALKSPVRRPDNADKNKIVINLAMLDKLHDALDRCDEYLTNLEKRRTVQMVLREHIQQLLLMVNGESDDSSAEDLPSKEGRFRFADLMTAPPEDRQDRLMSIYFKRLLPSVEEQVKKTLDKQQPKTEHNVEDIISVWCTLVFRMLCWLQLHDFDKDDVQILDSDLCGSRLPVYIW